MVWPERYSIIQLKTAVISLLLPVLVTISLQVTGQDRSKYDLLTERYVERPVAVHAGQLQINTGYEFSIINKIYDFDGNSLDLTEEGVVSARHLFPLEIKFGVIEFLQVRTKISYANQVIRFQDNKFYMGYGTITRKEIETTRGPDDLLACVDLTVPIPSEILNWVVTAGMIVPLFGHDPEQPDHTVEYLDPFPGSMNIRYNYLNKFSRGIPRGVLGTSIKIRLQKLAVSGHAFMEASLKEGESIHWESRLINQEIEYKKVPYSYDLGQTIDFGGTIAYQAIDWLALFASCAGSKTSGGWTTITGKKVAQGPITLHMVAAGYEIQVSPVLRIKQLIYYPVKGENILAPWIFETGIGLNFMTY